LKFLLKKQNKVLTKLSPDIIKIKGKRIFINPFLYSRVIDKNTKHWLYELGQINDLNIKKNRSRFYPNLNWESLNDEEKNVKYFSVEMFIKSLELIKIIHPEIDYLQLKEVEKKMLLFKKTFFEDWVKKSLKKKFKSELNKEKKFIRKISFKNWIDWLSLKKTKSALFFFVVMIFISAFLGWTAGISKNSCNPYFEKTI